MNIGYEELGRPEEMGDFLGSDVRTYSVSWDHVEQWREDPTIRFKVTEFSANKKPHRYILGLQTS